MHDLPSMKLSGLAPTRGAQLSLLDLSGNLGIKDVGIELLASAMQGVRAAVISLHS
jgi:hypothetical protein